MTSLRARIEGPSVRKLADDITQTQVREVARMKSLIADLDAKRHGLALDPGIWWAGVYRTPPAKPHGS